MSRVTESLRAARCVLAAAACAAAAGCVFIPPEPPLEPDAARVEVAPPPAPVPAAPAPVATPPAAPTRPAPPPVVEPPDRPLAVLHDGASAEHAAVAAEVAALLAADGHRVSSVNVRSADALSVLASQADLVGVAVAVGLEAATAARRTLAAPLVFCQVFNHEQLLHEGPPAWGVAAVPPIGLQLRAWKALDPSLERVALIVGASHAALAEEASAVGRELGIAVSYEIAASDLETSYLFRRAAPQVDGVWLPPDGRILSPGVLRELLDYALGHGVGVAVASDGLLEWGALFSATATTTNVAQTVREVVARVTKGRAADVPPLTPLSEVELELNPSVAAALGLNVPIESPWVLREPD